jgi:hypothetical protein
LASLSCDDCRKYWYDDEWNQIKSNATGLPILRDGPTLCEANEVNPVKRCPKGHWKKPTQIFNERNKRAWEHFQECDAVREFPNDPIVRLNAIIIRRAIVTAERRMKKKVA